MKGARRLLIILGAYIFNVALIIVIVVLEQWFSESTVRLPWAFTLVTSAVIVGTQIIFVIPIVRPPTLSSYGKSLHVSMLLAALFGGICTLAFATALYSLVMTIFLDFQKQDQITEHFFWYFLLSAWVFWSVLLLIFVKRAPRDAGPLVRVTGGLFAGSLIELLLSIPLTILVARRSDCYCATGSFFALMLSTFAALWLFGPFMVILLVWRKRPWGKDHCLSCGYPRKVTDSVVCSECGNDLLTQG
jgi:hypothetical protein